MIVRRWLRAASYAVSTMALALAATAAVIIWVGVDGDRVPVHWNGAFDPDRYGSKAEGALVPLLVLAVVIGVFAPIAGVVRPRTVPGSLHVLWMLIAGFVGSVVLATSGQTAAATEIGRSDWISPVLLLIALAAGLAGGAAGYAVGGREQLPARSLGAPNPPYWFKAKKYGFGWSRPLTWQGWLVMGGYLIAVLASAVTKDSAVTVLVVLVGTPLLLLACVRKGEPTSWRWGEERS